MALTSIPEIIYTTFEEFIDIPCWAFSRNKVPCQLKNPEYNLSWKENPDLGLITLREIEKWIPFGLHTGFGIFTGRFDGCKYGLGVLDYDHFLDKASGEPDYNNKLDKLLWRIPTFAEKSVSMEGIHGFFKYDKDDENARGVKVIDIKKMGIILENFLSEEEIRLIDLPKDDPERIEKGITKYMPGGSIYLDMHFTNLTGIPYKNNKYDLCNLNKEDFSALLEHTTTESVLPVIKRPTFQSSIVYGRSWDDILTKAGIPHEVATEYVFKERHGKFQIESWKIPCPNLKKHTKKRSNDKSSDLAILTKYSDGTSSLKCNHHNCSFEKRLNLLKMLWDRIKGIDREKVEAGNKLLREMGIIGQPEDTRSHEEKVEAGNKILKEIGVIQ